MLLLTGLQSDRLHFRPGQTSCFGLDSKRQQF